MRARNRYSMVLCSGYLVSGARSRGLGWRSVILPGSVNGVGSSTYKSVSLVSHFVATCKSYLPSFFGKVVGNRISREVVLLLAKPEAAAVTVAVWTRPVMAVRVVWRSAAALIIFRARRITMSDFISAWSFRNCLDRRS